MKSQSLRFIYEKIRLENFKIHEQNLEIISTYLHTYAHLMKNWSKFYRQYQTIQDEMLHQKPLI